MDSTPVTPIISNAPNTNSNINAKVSAVVPEVKGIENIKVETPKEAEVIRKIKVGDIEYDEAVLRQKIEKADGADRRFLEAANARKEALRVFKLAKTDPRKFLELTGLDPKKYAYDEVAKDIQEKLRDPKEVELERANERLKAFEAKEAAEKQRFEEQRLEQQAKALEQKFHQEIIGALENHPAIPKNGFSVAKIAKYIDTVRSKTGVLLSAEEVANTVEQDIKMETMGLLKGATAEQLMALIGEEGMATIRKYDIEKLKNPLKNNNTTPGTNQSSSQKEERKAKNSRDFWKDIDIAGAQEGFNKFGVKVRK
jgi:copper chaperone CopZ